MNFVKSVCIVHPRQVKVMLHHTLQNTIRGQPTTSLNLSCDLTGSRAWTKWGVRWVSNWCSNGRSVSGLNCPGNSWSLSRGWLRGYNFSRVRLKKCFQPRPLEVSIWWDLIPSLSEVSRPSPGPAAYKGARDGRQWIICTEAAVILKGQSKLGNACPSTQTLSLLENLNLCWCGQAAASVLAEWHENLKTSNGSKNVKRSKTTWDAHTNLAVHEFYPGFDRWTKAFINK